MCLRRKGPGRYLLQSPWIRFAATHLTCPRRNARGNLAPGLLQVQRAFAWLAAAADAGAAAGPPGSAPGSRSAGCARQRSPSLFAANLRYTCRRRQFPYLRKCGREVADHTALSHYSQRRLSHKRRQHNGVARLEMNTNANSYLRSALPKHGNQRDDIDKDKRESERGAWAPYLRRLQKLHDSCAFSRRRSR